MLQKGLKGFQHLRVVQASTLLLCFTELITQTGTNATDVTAETKGTSVSTEDLGVESLICVTNPAQWFEAKRREQMREGDLL